MSATYQMLRAAPVLWVRDMHGMIAFYHDRLCFPDVWKQGDETNPVYAIVSFKNLEIHLAPQKPEFAGHGNMHILMDNIGDYWETVKSHDIEIVKPLGDRDYGMRDFMIRDLEGNLIEFGQNLG